MLDEDACIKGVTFSKAWLFWALPSLLVSGVMQVVG